MRKREEHVPWCEVKYHVCQVKPHFRVSNEVLPKITETVKLDISIKCCLRVSFCKAHIQLNHRFLWEYGARASCKRVRVFFQFTLLLLHHSKTASSISDNAETVFKRAGNSIARNVTVTNGSNEGIKGWIRRTYGINIPCSGVHSPDSESILAVDCSLPGFNGVGFRGFPAYTCYMFSVSFDRS